MQCYGVRFNDRGYVGHLKFIFGRKLVLTHVTVINKISFLFKKKIKRCNPTPDKVRMIQ